MKLLMTGEELMTGDIVDSNSALMAERLFALGIRIAEKATLGDDLYELTSAMQRLTQGADVVIVNGGLGPTSDDLTAEALAALLGRPIVEHPEALAHLHRWCEARNSQLNDANRKQAMLPQGVEIIPNPTGSAVGFKVDVAGCRIYCTPGVPHELSAMLDAHILPELAQWSGAAGQVARIRFSVFGYGEASLQHYLRTRLGAWPEQVVIGYRASVPVLELKLHVLRAEDRHLLDLCAERIRHLLGAHIVSEQMQSMASVVQELLVRQGRKVTVAESCTGGLIASLLTAVPGASLVFDAGFVTYSNAMKTRLLGVSERTLASEGAVSEAVVREMLQGALTHSRADLGVAVSGIAGPDGGSEDKPVGTVWIAWGSADAIQSRCLLFPVGRVMFQKLVATLALDLVRRQCLGCADVPVYFLERKPK
jgi:nicotinamide-nucleotide amidase